MSADRSRRRPLAGSPLEWSAAAVSLLLVLGAIGYLVFDGLAAPSSAPSIRIEVDSVAPSTDGFRVEIRVRNLGQETAAELEVEGVLRDGHGVVETSRITLDYLPGESARPAGLFFTRDPRAHRLEIRPTGFVAP